MICYRVDGGPLQCTHPKAQKLGIDLTWRNGLCRCDYLMGPNQLFTTVLMIGRQRA